MDPYKYCIAQASEALDLRFFKFDTLAEGVAFRQGLITMLSRIGNTSYAQAERDLTEHAQIQDR